MKEKRLNLLDMKKGVYLDEVNFGKLHLMEDGVSVYGDKQYAYVGKIHKGEIKFVTGKDTNIVFPLKGDWDYGYTLEGEANNLFKAKNALVSYNGEEDRTFIYINDDSSLEFVGGLDKEYEVYIRIFDRDENGDTNFRWVVIYASTVEGNDNNI